MYRSMIILLVLMGSATAWGLKAPADFQAFDTPNDAGGSITLTWARDAGAPAGAVYQVMVATDPNGLFYPAGEVSAAGSLMAEDPAAFGFWSVQEDRQYVHVEEFARPGEDPTKLETDRPYYFRLEAWLGDESAASSAAVEARAVENFFNWAKLNNFILAVSFSAIILIYISIARRRDLYIRRIAGLEALNEALGRATEMGKPVLFIHGLYGMDQPSTIAAVNILGRVAQRTAEYDTELRVANYDPVVLAVSQEVVKESYLEAGRPDAYSENNVFLAATEQFSYAATLQGMMVRERPAANIMMGYFFAESLLLAETGTTIGAIQIAGTDSYTQLPFFVTTCDYTLMGEELYAASAYLARESRLLGSLKGQDIGKAVLIAVLLLGTALATLDIPFLARMFASY
jgi:hypothetical protein